jgi:CheY-like chemotaxis protein
VPPDLIISDVMMPGLDGFGLLRELRNEPRLRETPVICFPRGGEKRRARKALLRAQTIT